MNRSQLLEKSKPFCPPNTLKKNQWALNTFFKWRTELLTEGTCEIPGVFDVVSSKEDICQMTTSEMDVILSVFILSLKKADGGDYTADSLFSIICALQRHLEMNGRRVSLLNDMAFKKLRNALDNSMQDRTRSGIGITKKQATIITLEQESELWEKGILGDDTPEKLVRTVFWMIGLHFGLRGGEEHRNLSRLNFKIDRDSDGAKYLLYSETISKTYRGD